MGPVTLFEYPSSPGSPGLPLWDGSAWSDPENDAAQAAAALSAGESLRAEFEHKLAAETRRAFEAGRERGRIEFQQAGREAELAQEERRMRQAAELAGGLAQERDRYLQAVEHEVVQLALGVAARILRREAQMDPLLLTGAVRVALGQLSASTEVRLRVPPEELGLWVEAIALLPSLAIKPAVVPGEGMRLGDCAIETELGSVDIGIRAQLSEIERGFFDRARSPLPPPNPSRSAKSEAEP